VIFWQKSFALAELLADNLDDVVGVAVVAGEYQGLGNFGAVGEDVGEELVAKLADEGADLVRGRPRRDEVLGGVGEVGIEEFGTAGAGEAVRACRSNSRIPRASRKR